MMDEELQQNTLFSAKELRMIYTCPSCGTMEESLESLRDRHTTLHHSLWKSCHREGISKRLPHTITSSQESPLNKSHRPSLARRHAVPSSPQTLP